MVVNCYFQIPTALYATKETKNYLTRKWWIKRPVYNLQRKILSLLDVEPEFLLPIPLTGLVTVRTELLQQQTNKYVIKCLKFSVITLSRTSSEAQIRFYLNSQKGLLTLRILPRVRRYA